MRSIWAFVSSYDGIALIIEVIVLLSLIPVITSFQQRRRSTRFRKLVLDHAKNSIAAMDNHLSGIKLYFSSVKNGVLNEISLGMTDAKIENIRVEVVNFEATVSMFSHHLEIEEAEQLLGVSLSLNNAVARLRSLRNKISAECYANTKDQTKICEETGRELTEVGSSFDESLACIDRLGTNRYLWSEG